MLLNIIYTFFVSAVKILFNFGKLNFFNCVSDLVWIYQCNIFIIAWSDARPIPVFPWHSLVPFLPTNSSNNSNSTSDTSVPTEQSSKDSGIILNLFFILISLYSFCIFYAVI